MKALISTATKRTERVFLVGVELKSRSALDTRESLDELSELASTAGGEVVGDGTQKMEAPVAGTFIGSGKAEEFAKYCRGKDVDTVIFDDELSPAQSRNLEGVFDCKVLDRTSLILDIFAQRARTREGKLQIELAQLQHLLPRLTRFWGHLSRQKGGIGMRGDGETQLETDRRRVQDRISKIARELEVVRRQRSTQRQGRQRNLWPLASIVGYTNAGKSTLLNALTGSQVLSEDKLFATLDPTTRRLRLPTNQNVLLTDTVGFIRKLPHGLVEAFKATLEEVVQADLLLHVVDVSHPQAAEQIEAVNSVLNEIGASGKPTLMVFNKIDRLNGNGHSLLGQHTNAVAVSAKTGEGLPELLAELNNQVRPIREFMELSVPHEASAVIARLHAVGQVIERDYNGEKAWFKGPDSAASPRRICAVYRAGIADGEWGLTSVAGAYAKIAIHVDSYYDHNMSFNQVLAELPSLSFAQRQLLIHRAMEIDERGLSPQDEALVEARLAEHHRDPGSSIPLDEMKKRVRSRVKS